MNAQQIREHRRQMEKELVDAVAEGRLTDTVVRAYCRAIDLETALNENEKALARGEEPLWVIA